MSAVMDKADQGKGHIAAQIARDTATGKSSEYFTLLSGKMCWDAVIECQVLAGIKRPHSITTHSHDHVISLTDDKAVCSATDMLGVPQGASIGFFRDGTLMHFMICVGAGMAAGNKNACIGIGSPVGWEILQLAKDLQWNSDGFEHQETQYKVRYRAI
ncbi:MAG TPA: hypothetical protein PL007_00025 [Thermomonas sp.]|jgi:hypothetical protein|nr:hypothetical protein [Thermomonas sp.]HQY48736.1 hypothetical protein [Thermomonas sp.]HRA56150.1 hypothetical protein [Thermomonas sp.]